MSTAEDARALVSYAKFPVLKDKRTAEMISGVRGVGSPFAPAGFGMDMGEYIATANRNIFIAVQIETVEGLSNCEEIAKVDGIGWWSFRARVSLRPDWCGLPVRYALRWVCFSSP